jgi:hypothetical protein
MVCAVLNFKVLNSIKYIFSIFNLNATNFIQDSLVSLLVAVVTDEAGPINCEYLIFSVYFGSHKLMQSL